MANNVVTETLRHALQRSVQIAASNGEPQILPETLFQSIIADTHSQAAIALRKLGVTSDSTSKALANAPPQHRRPSDVSFSNAAAHVLDQAISLARNQGYKSAATFHIAAVIINDPPDKLRPFLQRSQATPEHIAIALSDPAPED